MFVYACLRHWYEGLIFFGPIPVVGIFVWLSGRRHAAELDAAEDRRTSTPPAAHAG